MHPILLKLGNITVYTYGFFIAIGFICGIFLAQKEAKRLKEDPDKIIDLGFWAIIFGLFGGRVFYVFTEPSIFISDPIEFFKIWHGGLVFYGGFIFAIGFGIFYLKKNKMPILKTLDIVAPSIALGHFFGRIGCFFAGCCYGKVCKLPWAVIFTNPYSLAPQNVPLHPTQIYEALSNISVFIFLWIFRTKKKFEGQLFFIYTLVYGILRFFIEFLRDDSRGEFFGEVLSTSQLIGLIISAISIIFYLKKISKIK